jgi:shikimate dehydrogenase
MFYSALIGRPVDHSVSPRLFNYLAKIAGLEYGHIKVNVASKKGLRDVLNSLRILGFCGANVTIPYKLEIIRHLDSVSREAKKIGAVNALTFKDNRAAGYNTDAYGALAAIEFKLKKIRKNDRVLVLGAGGAARAIVYALYEKTKNIMILNRNMAEALSLSEDISRGRISCQRLNDKNIKACLAGADIIINATPVGMHPDENKEIIKPAVWQGVGIHKKYFFDAIFNPYKTKFLKKAEAAGAKICPGTYMMIYQGIEAFRLWTGRKLSNVNIEEANNILRQVLSE